MAKLQTETCEFVKSSNLFKGYEDVWDSFADSDPDFSWGSNNRSLVTFDAILDHMDNKGIEYSEDFASLCDRNTYIDLEN